MPPWGSPLPDPRSGPHPPPVYRTTPFRYDLERRSRVRSDTYRMYTSQIVLYWKQTSMCTVSAGPRSARSATSGQQDEQRVERPQYQQRTSVTVTDSFSPAAEVPSSSPPPPASAWASYDSHTCSSHHHQLGRSAPITDLRCVVLHGALEAKRRHEFLQNSIEMAR